MRALLNNMNEQAAEGKLVSLIFLSMGTAARKSLTDKFPYMIIATVSMGEMKEICEQAFTKPRNRTLERYRFLAPKQKKEETLRQFWHALTGMAAKCELGDQSESHIMDAFIQNMNNKAVQERHCTEPKRDPQEAFRFAIAYEEGEQQHKTYEGKNRETRNITRTNSHGKRKTKPIRQMWIRIHKGTFS